MAATGDTRSEWALRAKAFYDAELRAKLEPAENGKYIIIDGKSLDYEVDDNPIVASVHLRDRQPHGQTLSFCIGFDSRVRGGAWPGDYNGGTTDEGGNGRRKKEKTALPAINRCFASLQAEAYYNAELRDKLEPAHNGKFILIDPESRDYEVDADLFAATVHLRDRQPDGEWIIFRIGYTDGEQPALHGMRMTLKP